MRVILPITGPYTAKDQAKSDAATKFIGRGSPQSSTNVYAQAWGAKANSGAYSPADVVFVSAEGARNNRMPANTDELRKACEAGATIITDTAHHRSRAYNVGEREVAEFLRSHGYHETCGNGRWNFNP